MVARAEPAGSRLSLGLNLQLQLLIGGGLAILTVVLVVLAVMSIRDTAMNAAIEMATSKLQGDKIVLENRVQDAFGQVALSGQTLVDENGEDLAGRFEMLDTLSQDLSIVATIFVSDGQDYRRLLTSIRNASGDRVIGTMLGTDSAAYQPIRNGQDYYGQASILGKSYVTGYSPLESARGEVIGILFVGVEMTNIEGFVSDEVRSAVFTESASGIVVFLLVLMASGWFVKRKVVQPLLASIHSASQISDGDLSADIDEGLTRRADEIGTLAKAIDTMVKQLRNVLGSVISGSDEITSASQQTSSTAQSLSQGASEQAASVEQTTASIEQMTASIQHNSESAATTDELSAQAAQKAVEGGKAVRETVSAMNSIAERIQIIDEIAYQTNLLALNAAIEAARAGQHGKGFAVVAAEVRKLAERSQLASKEIGEVAHGSLEVAGRAGKLLDELQPLIEKTSELVREISAASGEQDSGARQIGVAMEQLNSITQQSASASEQLASSSEELNGQAEHLHEVVSFFRLESNR
ncbi:MAG: methyl-accepting chemotaxis protein [Wenzhouxiangella sp.]|jgi:methyl-accepting chemotaxis protein|nr:methyl-accepting chemotaxis protein [Wenzhouxiangella sp.]